jgi:hypothetical protein
VAVHVDPRQHAGDVLGRHGYGPRGADDGHREAVPGIKYKFYLEKYHQIFDYKYFGIQYIHDACDAAEFVSRRYSITKFRLST